MEHAILPPPPTTLGAAVPGAGGGASVVSLPSSATVFCPGTRLEYPPFDPDDLIVGHPLVHAALGILPATLNPSRDLEGAFKFLHANLTVLRDMGVLFHNVNLVAASRQAAGLKTLQSRDSDFADYFTESQVYKTQISARMGAIRHGFAPLVGSLTMDILELPFNGPGTLGHGVKFGTHRFRLVGSTSMGSYVSVAGARAADAAAGDDGSAVAAVGGRGAGTG